MKYWRIFLVSLLMTLTVSVAYDSFGKTQFPIAPLFTGMGTHHHTITTKSPSAQRYFDQGLVLAYGFNHAEAARSFQQAAKLDSDCAMCYWGLAYVLGPNINAAMEDDNVPTAYEAMEKAITLASNSSESEQAYIQALSQRYVNQPVEDRSSLDRAYASAMKEVVQSYPEDLDAATLYAEAVMDTMPWNYWTKAGEPKPETKEVLTTLESVLERNPYHPGANHLYIHAVEAVKPEQGVAAADRLRNLVPGSGHLVHMPSHIYIRVGRYRDAAVANQKAIAVDRDYLAQCHAQGIYPLAYVPHNQHFLWFSAMFEGDSNLAIQSANQLKEMIDQEQMRQPGLGTLQHFYSIPLYTLTRFGKWDDILAQPQPEQDLLYPTGIWHYVRGLAFNAQGKPEAAQQELKQLQAIATDPAIAEVTIWDINPTQNILEIATQVLAGEIAAKQGNYEEAIAYLQQAVTLEDNLNYDEPADWSIPARQNLGAILIEANYPDKAEKVYQEDLAIYPDNGWSLFGLAQSLQAQGKKQEAQNVQQKFTKAWQFADINLISSRF